MKASTKATVAAANRFAARPIAESVATPVLLSVAAGAMLWWSWGRWPDPVVDFGKEIYIAWQLAAGKTLYTDIAYFNGPFSPYVDALWLRLFGTSLRTLTLCNIAIAGIVAAMLFRLLREAAGRFAATASCLLFFLLFAFTQFTPLGNYNFVCPITHEMTHGTALSLAAILTVDQYQRSRRTVWIAACGGALGLVFLTRAEFFLAAAAAVALGLGLGFRAERESPHRSGGALRDERTTLRSVVFRLALFLACALATPVIAFALLATTMPAAQALLGALGNWPSVLKGDVARLPFYQRGLGLDDAGASVLRLLVISAGEAVLGGAAALIALRVRVAPRVRSVGAALSFVATAAALLVLRSSIPWDELARPLPIALLAVAVLALAAVLRRGAGDPAARPLVLRLTLIAFGGTLLLKMILNARIFHYGFAMAMPATLVCVCGLLEWIPVWIERRGGAGSVFRGAALGALFATTVVYLQGYAILASRKVVEVGHGGDAFLADERGTAVNEVVAELARRAAPTDTLAVMPEGGFLNYLSRLPNSTPYPILMPTEMTMFGEDRVLGGFQAHPPDFIALVHRDTSAFAVRFFGRDYGQRIGAWVEEAYEPVFQSGAPPFQDDRFGILLMERKSRRAGRF